MISFLKHNTRIRNALKLRNVIKSMIEVEINRNEVIFFSVVEVLVSAGPLPIGTYVLEFELSSDCGYTDSKSLNVIVVNSVSERNTLF